MTSQFGDRKKLKSRIVWTLLALIVLGGGAFLFWKPLLYLANFAMSGSNVSMTKAVDNRPLGYFYRFTASYSHKGERLNFDYVVACNIRVTSYRGGGTSNDSTYTPKVMMMPTSDGGAIMVRTIRACKGETTANGKVPEDLFPMAIWFDDVNDMTFGWGYATEDAYESELSQLEFHGASVEVSTRERWEAWREASAKGFDAVGMIKTPWGTNYDEPWSFRSAEEPYDASKRLIARACAGYSRLKLPDNIRADIRALMPENTIRFWSPSPKARIQSILKMGHDPEKGPLIDYFSGGLGSGTNGLPLRNGNGTLWRHYANKIPSPVYPLLPRSKSSSPTIIEPVESYPQRLLFENGRWLGFLACGGDALYDDNPLRFDPDIGSKKQPVYVDEYLVLETFRSLGLPTYIFDQDEYVFTINPAGVHAP